MKRVPGVRIAFLVATLSLGCQGTIDNATSETESIASESTVQTQTFALLTGYRMYEDYQGDHRADKNRALKNLSKHGASGMIYANLGRTEEWYRDDPGRFGSVSNEKEYNEKLLEDALVHHTDMWLQITPYNNRTWVAPNTYAALSAQEILEDREIEGSSDSAETLFRKNLRKSVRVYTDRFTDNCRIVLFEEESPYHAFAAGGGFWYGDGWPTDDNSEPLRDIEESAIADQRFVERLPALFSYLRDQILDLEPSCKVGIHIGHTPLYRQFQGKTLFEGAMDRLSADEKPDFILYDLYLKAKKHSFPDFDDPYSFETTLPARVAAIDNALPDTPIYHMAQLHTMNQFAHGGGRTPSEAQIRANMELALDLGVEGLGYYTKNAAPTFTLKTGPLPEDDNDFAPVGGDYCEHVGNNTSGEDQWVKIGGRNTWQNFSSGTIANLSCSVSEDASPYDENSSQGMVYQNSSERWFLGMRMLKNFRARR